MAELITGLQGSGKSYYAMYKIYYEQNKYYKIFTNLDGLKQTDKIIPLDFKKFTDEILTECYNLIVTQSKEYQEVIEYLQRLYILPQNVSKENRILLVIDEAQNYFSKKNPILSWFVTQHRHLYMELYLITQKYTLLHADYHLFNLAYNAFPPVKQFSKKSIAYKEFAGLPMSDDNFVRKFSLKKESKIFDMYVSGDKVDSPFILKKFIPLIIIFLAIIGGGIYYFTNVFGQPEPKKVLEQKTKSKNPLDTKISTYVDEEDKLYTIVVFEDYFYIDDVGGDYYPLKLLLYIKEHYFKTVIDKVKRDDYHTVIYVICSSSIENMFKSKKKKSTLGDGVDTVTSFY
jgi:zona occludens toxin